MSPVERRRIHGPIQPMDASTDALSQWRALINSRPAGEPHPTVGVGFLCCMLALLIVGLAATFPAASQPSPRADGTTSPASIEAAAGDTGDRL